MLGGRTANQRTEFHSETSEKRNRINVYTDEYRPRNIPFNRANFYQPQYYRRSQLHSKPQHPYNRNYSVPTFNRFSPLVGNY